MFKKKYPLLDAELEMLARSTPITFRLTTVGVIVEVV
jgi:hypothetical protein